MQKKSKTRKIIVLNEKILLMSRDFSELDCKIVGTLFENARVTNAELAKQIHLSESQCSRRLKRIEQSGVITGYTARVDPAALGLNVYAFLGLNIDHTRTTRQDSELQIRKHHQLFRGYRTGGNVDYIVSILTPDLSEYQVSVDKFNAINGVTVTRSLLILDSIKYSTRIQFPFTTLTSPAYILSKQTSSTLEKDQITVRPSLPALRGDLSHSKLDDIDLELIRRLADNSRSSLVDLGKQVGLSPAPCGRRVHQLERRGIIQQYTAKINFDAIGLTTVVLIEVKFDLTNTKDRQTFEERLIQAPQVLEAYRTHGESNYLIVLIVENLATCDQFLADTIFQAQGLISVQSSPVLKQFHDRR